MAYNDGSAYASTGSPQYANLLDQYGANRAPFEVAGVDYRVGTPQGLALKDPATIAMAGVSVNTATHSITITGNNVTLDGYNFSGWNVVTTAANTSLINSTFNGLNPGGSQDSVISGTSTSSNLLVSHCTIDGMAGSGGRAEFLVEMQGPGLTVEYSWLRNSNSDIIGRHGASGGDITIQNNLIENAGMGGAGTHGDYLQVYGPTVDSTHILFNTTIQNGGTTQGFIADNTRSGEFAGNTMIGSLSYFMSASGPGTDAANFTGVFNTHDNYFDASRAFGFNYPDAGPNDSYAMTRFTHNVNMVTGRVEQDSNAPTTSWPAQTSTPTPTPTPTPTAPSAPTIASFSNDSGTVGDRITNDSTLTLAGSAAANSTVKVFDGTTQIGTTTANSSGAWSYTTAALSNGNHSLTATATTSSGTSSASSALAVQIDTVAPNAPTIATPTNNANGGLNLAGTAEANSVVRVYDGTTQIGTATANSSGSWSYTANNLADGSHSLTARATDAAGNTGAASSVVTASTGAAPTPPAAPRITSFSNDSGTAGDGVTNDSTLTLSGTAAAGSTVKVFDGTTQVGTATANSSGAWSYTTASLSNGNHSLTATATTSSGTSTASSALSVRIDTVAPNAPTIATPTNNANGGLNLTGTAEANSVVAVYDGTTQIGTATTNGSGTWSYTTGSLAAGSHSLTARATDTAGNTGAASSVVTASTGGGTSPTPTAPAAPRISSFSNDSGVVGDRITNDSTLTLTGTAVANGTVKVFDGTTQIGTATANSSGAWSYTTSALADGNHNLTATVTDSSGRTSVASSALAVGIDTTAPTAPSMSYTSDGDTLATARSVSTTAPTTGGTTDVDHVTLNGTAEANSSVRVFDGTTQIGTATANSSGAWSYTADNLADGSHSFTSKAVDAAGNTSAASTTLRVNVDTHTEAPTEAPPVEFTNVRQHWWNDKVVFRGTTDPNAKISIYDDGGTTPVAKVRADADGAFSVTTSSRLSDDVVHRFTATVTDSTGQAEPISGSVVLGTSRDNRLTSTSGNDLFRGNGGNDAFEFAANFGNDVIADFGAGRRGHDVVQFSRSVFDDFADVLAHASQDGRDVVIDAGGGNSLTLKNTSLTSLDKSDFHFA